MSTLITFIIASAATTIILMIAAVLTKPRNYIKGLHPFFNKLLSCSMCLGFWVGGLISLTTLSPTGFFLWDMFIASFSTWVIYLLCVNLEENRLEKDIKKVING